MAPTLSRTQHHQTAVRTRSMSQMVKSLRGESLVELVDEWGIERVSRALGVSEERVLRLIAQSVS